MTASFWVLFVMYLVKTIGFVLLYRSHQRLAELNARIGALHDDHAAMYRAAYRDLIGDYTRLHTKYKELQHDRRAS